MERNRNKTKTKLIIIGVAVTILVSSIVGISIPLSILGSSITPEPTGQGEILGDDSDQAVSISGTYTGTHYLAKTAIVEENNTALFTNAKIYGAEIYVLGNLTIEDSELDHSIHCHGGSVLNATNVTHDYGFSAFLKHDSTAIIYGSNHALIHAYDTSRVIIECSDQTYIWAYDSATVEAAGSGSYFSFNMHDSSTLSFSDASLNAIDGDICYFRFTGQSTGTITGVTYTGSTRAIFSCVVESRVWLVDSNISSLTTWMNGQVNASNSTISRLDTEDFSEACLISGTTVDILYGRDNSIVYVDGTSTINEQNLYEGAQVQSI